MANPFTSPSISGYNPGAPPDDGSQVASNLATWADIKNDLSDPVKSLAETISTNVSTAFGKIFGNNVSATSSNYTVVAGDQGKVLSCTNTITITLLAVATASSNFTISVYNAGSGTITVDGNDSETVNGVASITIDPGGFAILSSNGSAWTAMGVLGTTTDAKYTKNLGLLASVSANALTVALKGQDGNDPAVTNLV